MAIGVPQERVIDMYQEIGAESTVALFGYLEDGKDFKICRNASDTY
jgi:hypothetical protein